MLLAWTKTSLAPGGDRNPYPLLASKTRTVPTGAPDRRTPRRPVGRGRWIRERAGVVELWPRSLSLGVTGPFLPATGVRSLNTGRRVAFGVVPFCAWPGVA